MEGIVGYETSSQVAERLGIDQSQVRRYCTQGRLKGAIKVANTWFVPEGEVPDIKGLGRPPTWEQK
jgi:predicted site-specific integrase-resolvase